MNLQIKGLNGALVAQAAGLNLHGGLAATAGAFVFNSCQIVKILAHHGGHQLYAGQFGHRVLAHQRAVAQHGDAVTHGIHLLQKMRDKHNAHAVFF